MSSTKSPNKEYFLKKLLKLLEKNYFEHLYLALEKRDNERGFGPYIHFFDEDPHDSYYINVMKFNDFLLFLSKNPIENLYFFGPLVNRYQNNW